MYLWVGRCGPALHTLTMFKTNITDFLTLFKTELRFLMPFFKTFKVMVTRSCVAFLLCNQWKFNVPGINAKVNGSQYQLTRACTNFAVHRPRKDILFKTKNDKPIP